MPGRASRILRTVRVHPPHDIPEMERITSEEGEEGAHVEGGESMMKGVGRGCKRKKKH